MINNNTRAVMENRIASRASFARWYAWVLITIVGGLWTFVCVKTVLGFSSSDQQGFIFRAALISVLFIVSIYKKRKKTADDLPVSSSKKSSKISISYQEIQDEHLSYQEKLKSYRYWTLGCLLVALIFFTTLHFFDNPLLSHPGVTTLIFCAALLVGTKDLEKQRIVDEQLVQNTMKGFQKEMSLKNNSIVYFENFIKKFEGMGMFGHAFVRVSPVLMIVFSLINLGLSPLLSTTFPGWIENATLDFLSKGIPLAATAFAFGKFSTTPYRYLLAKKHRQVGGTQ